MTKYLTQHESQEIDDKLLALGFTFEQLVEMAGYSAFEVIQNIIQNKHTSILVIVGPGNNGADGLVIARWLTYVGHKVSVLIHITKYPELLRICENLNITVYNEFPNHEYDYVIDAMFGFSFKAPLREPYTTFVDAMKSHPGIISIDVPSSYSVDCENNDPLFIPMCVVCLVGPKICCKNVKTYVARAFVPKEVYNDEVYTNFITYTEL